MHTYAYTHACAHALKLYNYNIYIIDCIIIYYDNVSLNVDLYDLSVFVVLIACAQIIKFIIIINLYIYSHSLGSDI